MQSYQLILAGDNQIVAKEGKKVEYYTLSEAPKEHGLLVQANKKVILGSINLESMLKNLDNCVDLLKVTYNAVNGMPGLHNGINALQIKFADAMIKSNETVLEFRTSTETVIQQFLFAYDALISGSEQDALDIFGEIIDTANTMITKASELVVVFEGISKETEKKLDDIITTNTKKIAKRDEVILFNASLKASIEALQTIKENLMDEIEQYNEEYNKLEARQKKQEDRAYDMQITSLIVSAVSSVFGGAVNAVQDNKQNNDMVTATTPQDETANKTREEYENNLKQQETLKKEIETIETRISQIDTILNSDKFADGENADEADASNPDSAKTGEELRTEKQDLTAHKSEKNNQLNSLKSKNDTLKGALDGFGKAFDKVADGTQKMSEQAQQAAESLNARMDKIAQYRRELKKQERENLKQLAEYTKQLQNSVITKDALDVAINSLVVATGCMRKVVSYLKEIVLFWTQVKSFCEKLAGDKTRDYIRRSIKVSDDIEIRSAPFKRQLFVVTYIESLARWVALNVVCNEYLDAIAKISHRINETIGETEMMPEEHWKQATTLAAELNSKIGEEIVLLETEKND